MDESDRTAIHEVMEQQTISISKAGITTTLNARTSILAAANPLYGRYNPKISPVENINLPAALLSRFDVLFLILDTPTREDDERLAQHVTYVHMHNTHPELDFEPVEPTTMRHYIASCRRVRPIVPPAMSEYIVSSYVQQRQQQKQDEADDKNYSYVSPRTLLAVLRLSQALARVRLADVVRQDDIDEALRLMDVSKASLYEHQAGRGGEDQTDTSKIFRIIKEMATGPSRHGRGRSAEDYEEEDGGEEELEELTMTEVRSRVLAKGFTETQLMDTVLEVSQIPHLMYIQTRMWKEMRLTMAVRKHGRLDENGKRSTCPIRQPRRVLVIAFRSRLPLCGPWALYDYLHDTPEKHFFFFSLYTQAPFCTRVKMQSSCMF